MAKTSAMARIYARQVRAGKMAFEEVPELWRDASREAYIEIYGEDE